MLKIRIEQQPALIGLQTQKSQLQMHRTPPRLEMTTDSAQLKINSTRPRLAIDQSQCFAAVNRRIMSDFALHIKEMGWQKSMEAIAHIAQLGDSLGAIENEAGIADIIAQDSMPEMAELEIMSMPAPNIHFEIHPLNIEYVEGKINIDYIPGKLEVQFNRGWVEVYLRQKNHIEVKAEEVSHDISI